MRSPIASLIPAFLRHLEAYAEVASDDVRDAAALLARKFAAVLAAVTAAVVALIMLCMCLVAFAWDGPWRDWVTGGLALGFALAAPALRAGLRPPASVMVLPDSPPGTAGPSRKACRHQAAPIMRGH